MYRQNKTEGATYEIQWVYAKNQYEKKTPQVELKNIFKKYSAKAIR